MERSPHLDPDWLRRKYIDEGLSTYDIGKLVNRNPKCVWYKLKDFGIPTRPRGANLHGQDNSWAQPGFVNHWVGRRQSAEARAKISAKATGPKPRLRGAANGMYGRFGPLNPNYKDGSAPERALAYASSEWREIMRIVYRRDGYRCRNCGKAKSSPRSLHAHHVYPWAGFPALRFELWNIVTLCVDCHRWVHSRRNVDREWLPGCHTIPSLSSSPMT